MSTITGGRLKTGSSPGSAPWTTTEASELYDVPRWGQGYFSVTEQGHLQVHPTKEPSRGVDLKRLVDRLQLRGLARADPDPLHRHPEAPARRDPRRLPERDRPEPVPGQVPLRLPDQGEPAAPGRRGSAELRRAVRLRPRGRQQAGAAGRVGDGDQRHADHLQRLQGFRVHRDGDAGAEDGPPDHPGGREVQRARADPRVRREGRRAPEHRHARQAGGARLGPLAVVGRLPLEVRPDGHRDPARPRGAEDARHGGLPQAAALPSRQPDHAHPHHQERAERSGAGLLRAGQAGRRPRVHGRRRRPRRGLRRFTDELRVVDELHAAGIRQRRRLPHPDGVRRSRASSTRPSSRRAAAPSRRTTAC